MSERTTGVRWSDDVGRFAIVPEWVIKHPGVGATAIRVYALLALHADERGASFKGRKGLAKDLGLSSTSTVDRALTELRDIGALSIEPRYRDDGSRTSNTYVLHARSTRVSEDTPPEESVGGPPEEMGGHELDPVERKGSTTDVVDPDASIASVPKLTRIAGRDVAFDVLAEVCGVDPSGGRGRELATALNGSKRTRVVGIREQFWRECSDVFDDELNETDRVVFEERLAVAVRARAHTYLSVMGNAVLTPTALAKWWTDLPKMREQRGRGLTPEEILATPDADL